LARPQAFRPPFRINSPEASQDSRYFSDRGFLWIELDLSRIYFQLL
jgi:hypothetical protein